MDVRTVGPVVRNSGPDQRGPYFRSGISVLDYYNKRSLFICFSFSEVKIIYHWIKKRLHQRKT